MVASSVNNEQSPVSSDASAARVCETVAEETEKQLAAYRREKEKFGKHPLWRRLTGLTFDYEAQVTAKQRKWGLRQLVKWIRRSAKDEVRSAKRAEGTANGTRLQHRGAEDTEVTENGSGERISLTQKWDREPEEWARAKKCGMQVEEICARLQISSTRLSALVREACGVSASELIDGFKIERVRKGLFEKLRDLARELWGVPGYMVYEKLGPHGRTAVGRMQEAGGRSNGTGNNVKTEDAENVDGECKVAPSPLTPLPRGGEGDRSDAQSGRIAPLSRGEGDRSGASRPSLNPEPWPLNPEPCFSSVFSVLKSWTFACERMTREGEMGAFLSDIFTAFAQKRCRYFMWRNIHRSNGLNRGTTFARCNACWFELRWSGETHDL